MVKSATTRHRPVARASARPAAQPARKAPTRRRALAIARTREDILLAAARTLARSGFKAVSMNEIAAEVGFTAPALYAYFDSKEAIFAELLRTMGAELDAAFERPPAGTMPLREKLATLVRRHLAWADKRREVLLAFFSLRMRGETLALGEPAGTRFGPVRFLENLSSWLQQAARRPGDLAGRTPEEAACLLAGTMQGFLLRWLTSGGAGPAPKSGTSHGRGNGNGQIERPALADQTDRVLDFYFHGLCGDGQKAQT